MWLLCDAAGHAGRPNDRMLGDGDRVRPPALSRFHCLLAALRPMLHCDPCGPVMLRLRPRCQLHLMRSFTPCSLRLHRALSWRPWLAFGDCSRRSYFLVLTVLLIDCLPGCAGHGRRVLGLRHRHHALVPGQRCVPLVDSAQCLRQPVLIFHVRRCAPIRSSACLLD